MGFFLAKANPIPILIYVIFGIEEVTINCICNLKIKAITLKSVHIGQLYIVYLSSSKLSLKI